jgi:hypothetical protein|tara:strand:+ start:835 stop:1197 length:363 start_codon:yes stop_codon:yes gene_type:complete
MTAPNIAGLSTVTGKSVGLAVDIASADLIANAANSNKVFKINSLVVSNVDGSSTASCEVILQKSGSNNFNLVKNIDVPAETALIVISKETQIYLEENDKITISASAGGDLHAICSYEEIS